MTKDMETPAALLIAANAYLHGRYIPNAGGSVHFVSADVTAAFTAGAEWQKAQPLEVPQGFINQKTYDSLKADYDNIVRELHIAQAAADRMELEQAGRPADGFVPIGGIAQRETSSSHHVISGFDMPDPSGCKLTTGDWFKPKSSTEGAWPRAVHS